MRANYARLLINNKQLKEARDRVPDAAGRHSRPIADIVVTMGLLSLQMNEFDAAETSLKRGLELKYRDPDSLRFYLGQVYEERKRYDDAMKHYYARCTAASSSSRRRRAMHSCSDARTSWPRRASTCRTSRPPPTSSERC